MKKKIWVLMSAMIITAMIFASCAAGTQGGDPQPEGVVAGASENAAVSDPELTEEVTEPTSEPATESTTEATTEPTTESTTKETTTAKPTTTQKQTTTKKETTTQKQTTTQKPTTTTTKPATTKPTTTQKNVTAKEVQDQVNAYIKSKGLMLDSTLTPSTASWNVPTARSQADLNNGYTLCECKDEVDYLIKFIETERTYFYCYYDNDSFYVLYI